MNDRTMTMDIRKLMTLCPSCIPPHQVCLPFTTSISPRWLSSSSSGSLAEDGGISLAEYSPQGDILCEMSDISFSDKESFPSMSCNNSSSSYSLSDESLRGSNEALADKSLYSVEVSCSTSFPTGTRKPSSNSCVSNEAEAPRFDSSSSSSSNNISSVSSYCSSSMYDSLSPNEVQSSLQSFEETPGGGEALADSLSSCDTSRIVDSLDSLCSTPTSANIDSLSLPASTPQSPQNWENDLSK